MDNAFIHSVDGIIVMIQQVGTMVMFLPPYGTAQMQRRTLASKSIASAWIITDLGGMAPVSLTIINLILVGWILASETSAMPLWLKHLQLVSTTLHLSGAVLARFQSNRGVVFKGEKNYQVVWKLQCNDMDMRTVIDCAFCHVPSEDCRRWIASFGVYLQKACIIGL